MAYVPLHPDSLVEGKTYCFSFMPAVPPYFGQKFSYIGIFDGLAVDFDNDGSGFLRLTVVFRRIPFKSALEDSRRVSWWRMLSIETLEPE